MGYFYLFHKSLDLLFRLKELLLQLLDELVINIILDLWLRLDADSSYKSLWVTLISKKLFWALAKTFYLSYYSFYLKWACDL